MEFASRYVLTRPLDPEAEFEEVGDDRAEGVRRALEAAALARNGPDVCVLEIVDTSVAG